MGSKFWGLFPETDAVFVDENMRVFVTSGLEDSFHPDYDIEVIFKRSGQVKMKNRRNKMSGWIVALIIVMPSG